MPIHSFFSSFWQNAPESIKNTVSKVLKASEDYSNLNIQISNSNQNVNSSKPKDTINSSKRITHETKDFCMSTCPFNNAIISSKYGNRINPTKKEEIQFHKGIDIVKNQPGTVDGTKVLSLSSGKVVRLVTEEDDDGGGVRVAIESEDGHTFKYFHLKRLSNSHLKVGQSVEKGEEIGKVGNTGTHTTGSHLHFEIRDKNNKPVNPFEYFPEWDNNIPI